MKIDIEATRTVEGDSLQKLVMLSYGYDALYHFRYANEESASVVFNPDDLKAFQPNTTVSEMMDSWEKTIYGNIDMYKECIKKKIHPYWTTTRLPKATHIITKQEEEIGFEMFDYPQKLVKAQREYYESVIKEGEERSGTMIFEKIV